MSSSTAHPAPASIVPMHLYGFIHSAAVTCIDTCEALPEGLAYTGLHSRAPPTLECTQRGGRVEAYLTEVSDASRRKIKLVRVCSGGSVVL